MSRKIQKTLSLPLPVVERLENESDETGEGQSQIVEHELRGRYEMDGGRA